MKKERNPKVSVIIPIYNIQEYIGECLKSVLSQSLQDIEVIAINDCSSDNSFETAKKACRGDSRVSFAENEANLGLGETRNVGMRMAKGKYIYFLDGDDVLLENALEEMYSFAESRSSDIVHLNSYFMPKKEFFQPEDFPSSIKKDQFAGPFPDNVAERLQKTIFAQHYSVMVWLNLYRREFLMENNLWFLPIIYEDTPFAISCLAATSRIDVLFGKPFCVYRQRNGSLTRSDALLRTRKIVRAMVLGLRYLRKELSGIGSSACISIMGAYFGKMYAKFLLSINEMNEEQRGQARKEIENSLKPLLGNDAFLASIMLCHLHEYHKKSIGGLYEK